MDEEYTCGSLDEERFHTAGAPPVLSRDAFAVLLDEGGLRTAEAPPVLSRDAFGPAGLRAFL